MDKQFILAKYYELCENKLKHRNKLTSSYDKSKQKDIDKLNAEINLIMDFIKDLENFIYNIFQNIEHKEIYEILKKRGKLDE